jgi:hypothetical protein
MADRRAEQKCRLASELIAMRYRRDFPKRGSVGSACIRSFTLDDVASMNGRARVRTRRASTSKLGPAFASPSFKIRHAIEQQLSRQRDDHS